MTLHWAWKFGSSKLEHTAEDNDAIDADDNDVNDADGINDDDVAMMLMLWPLAVTPGVTYLLRSVPSSLGESFLNTPSQKILIGFLWKNMKCDKCATSETWKLFFWVLEADSFDFGIYWIFPTG